MRLNLGVKTTDGTIAKPCLEIIAGARDLQLMELGISLVAATQSEIGIGFPAAAGITPTSPIAPVGMGDPNWPLARVAVAWGTAPTVPAKFLRVTMLQGVIGQSQLWTFDDFKSDKPNGIFIPAGRTFVIWNISAASLLDVSLVLEERKTN